MRTGAAPSSASLLAMPRSMTSSAVPSRAQVRPPRLGHRRQQRARGGAGSSTVNRHGRVWWGAGAVHAARDRLLERLARHRARRRTTGSCGARGAPAAATRGTDPRRRAGSGRPRGRRARRRGRRPRTIAAGTRASLRHHEPARRGDLVGERDDRRLQRAVRGGPRRPRRSTAAGSPAQPIATFTSPLRHGASEGVGDHDAERRRPSRSRSACAQSVRRRRRDPRAAAPAMPVLDVRRVDAGVRADEPVRASRRSRGRRDGPRRARSPARPRSARSRRRARTVPPPSRRSSG